MSREARRSRKRFPPLLATALLATLLGCGTTHPPLPVAEDVSLDRYLGRWYEIASFPQRFQKGCVATRATYTRRDDGRIGVRNECRDGSFDGELRSVEGVAWVRDPEQTNAKLEVQFFWPFRGDYWILEVGPDYRFAMVGQPSREYLWILSRTPTLPADVYEGLLERAAARGFDLARLNRTPQPPEAR
ncbi:MAG: lipocalin family protein [Myxococcales bacterium]|nr:lipocalin family protein [Myxococcales bacterium]